ncbi:hypothetical protein WJX73_007622 [Symbiochloris irregularis]|uniref:Protein kinase domain-containing protein n=1 Tax=Symbiochloris irregularis TaxID=706552 RepID=A0AAW1NYQ9_9CHLO
MKAAVWGIATLVVLLAAQAQGADRSSPSNADGVAVQGAEGLPAALQPPAPTGSSKTKNSSPPSPKSPPTPKAGSSPPSLCTQTQLSSAAWNNLWPFDAPKQSLLIGALTYVLPGISPQNISITNAVLASPSGRRRLLQSSTSATVNVSSEIDTGSLQGASAARNVLTSANLQQALYTEGLNVTSASLTGASLATQSNNHTCTEGTLISGTCAGGSSGSSGLATWAIIVIVVVIIIVLGIITLIGVCCCLVRRRKQRYEQRKMEAMGANVFDTGMSNVYDTNTSDVYNTGSYLIRDDKNAGTAESHVPTPHSNSGSSEQTSAKRPMVSPSSGLPISYNRQVNPRTGQPYGTGSRRTKQAKGRQNSLASANSQAVSRTNSGTSSQGQLTGRQPSLTRVPSWGSTSADPGKRIAMAHTRAAAFAQALAPKNASNAAAAIASRNPSVTLSVPGLSAAAAEYIKRPFNLGGPTGTYDLGAGVCMSHGRMVARGRCVGDGRPIMAELHFKNGTFLHARAFFNLALPRLNVPEVIDIMPASDLHPLMVEFGMSAIITEEPSYTLQDWMPSTPDADPNGRKRALLHILEAVNVMHAEGIAHRSLSLDTIAWFESFSRWQPATFARWGRAGSDKPVLYELRYAAPEVIMADVMGTALSTRQQTNNASSSSSIGGSADLPSIGVVDPASDLWAVGCIAWTLFTGKPLFGDNIADAEVAAMLMGTERLPFEAEPRLWEQFEKYQAFRLVNGLLTRRPDERLTAAQALEIAEQLPPQG